MKYIKYFLVVGPTLVGVIFIALFGVEFIKNPKPADEVSSQEIREVKLKESARELAPEDKVTDVEDLPNLDKLVDADTLQGFNANYFAPLTSLEGFVLGASDINPGIFGGTTDYTFPGNVIVASGQIYFTPINLGWQKEGVVYYDIDDSKLYVRGPSSWIDLTQQNSDSTTPTSTTIVVGASNSKNSSTRVDYRADGTDDNVELQSAIDALPTVGGKVVLLEGTYNITSAIILRSNLEISGNNWGTKLVLQSATNIFKWDDNFDNNSDGRPDPGGAAISNVFIHNLELDGNKSSFSTPSSSADIDAGYYAAIKIYSSSRIRIENLYIHDMEAGFAITLKSVDIDQGIDTGASDALINDNLIRNIGDADKNNGAIYSDLDNTIISRNIISSILGNGINIDVSDEGLITDNTIESVTAPTGGQGYAIVTGYGATGITIADNTISNSSRGIANHIGGSLVGDDHVITGNIIRNSSSTRDYAIKLQDDGHTVANNRITNWGQTGIFLDAVQNSTIIGNVINSSGAGNTSGIEVKTGSHNLVISDNVIYDMGTVASKGHGITLSSGTALNNILISGNRSFDSGAGVQDNGILLYTTPSTSQIQIEGNYLEDNVSNAIKVDGGSGFSSTLRPIRNRGFTTENSGTAVITSGNTSVSISHGLNLTPTASDIQLTPTNNLGNATKFWVSSVGGTTFDINVDSDPGGSTATFTWAAQIY